LFFLLPQLPPPTLIAKPVRVSDGDTVTIQGTRVRLACIDAPESSQTRGEEARATLQKMIQSRIPRVLKLDTDRYGRTVGLLMLDNRNLNLEMVRQGQAFVYHQYLSTCPSLVRAQLLDAESQARNRKLGVWQDEPPDYPWNFRKENYRGSDR